MNCEAVWNLISARVDGEIAGPDDATLEAHLAVCPDCRATHDAFRLQDSDMRRAFVPRRKAAGALANRVIEGLEPEDTRRAPFNGFALALLAAAAGFLLALALFPPWQTARPDAEVVRPIPAPPPDAGPTGTPRKAPAAEPVSAAPATLALATGLVEVFAEGSWKPLEPGGELFAGAKVRTAQGAPCEFRTREGSEVRLQGGSEAAFHSNRRIELLVGRIFSSVEHDAEPFEVRVLDARVTAIGTKFDIDRGTDAAVLTMVEGVAKVTGNAGDDYVYRGWKATISGGRVVEQVRAREIAHATGWVNRLLIAKGEGNPELATRLNDLLARIGEVKIGTLYEDELLELGESCVRPLLSFLQSDLSSGNDGRAAGAARVVSQLAPRWAVKDLIQLLAVDNPEVRFHAASALERLTGASQGRKPEAWRGEPWSLHEGAYRSWLDWWEAHRSEFPPLQKAQSTK